MSDTDDFRYTVQLDADGEGQVAGVMDASGRLPADVPPHWGVYIGVADTDRAVAQITELGGSVVQPPEDTPFGRIDWAELRREHFVRGVSIRALAEQTGLSRNTVRRALRSERPPRFVCPPRPSRLEPFREAPLHDVPISRRRPRAVP